MENKKHEKVDHGLCKVCGHYGDDCTGIDAETLESGNRQTYTPGPWELQPLQADHGASLCIASGAFVIAVIPPTNADDEPDMDTAKRDPHDEANGRLLAAAPEMLEALQRCRDLLLDSVNFDKGDYETTAAVSIADVIIEKAKGQ